MGMDLGRGGGIYIDHKYCPISLKFGLKGYHNIRKQSSQEFLNLHLSSGLEWAWIWESKECDLLIFGLYMKSPPPLRIHAQSKPPLRCKFKNIFFHHFVLMLSPFSPNFTEIG